MSRKVRLVVVCEDRQQQAFALRFLEAAGWERRKMQFQPALRGKGSAEQFVREQFPRELRSFRSKSYQKGRALVVVLDGDERGVAGRFRQLEEACRKKGVKPRQKEDRVAFFVPTWNIETWLAYLDGETVDEKRGNYPRLDRPRDCQPHVDCLHQICQQGALRQPSPPSLDAACKEYRQRLQP